MHRLAATALLVSTPVEYRVSAFNAQAALGEINFFRRQHGLKPVVLGPRLNKAASKQASDQARSGKIGHEGADGSRPMQRAERAGYNANLTAENVASGQRSFSEAMQSWERSPEHKRNLLLPTPRRLAWR